ncbi:MAG: hypothetical protein NT154_29235 [Verrucomicrobia bacterium]|nr:hypothetical protein [Verrucomicrobiota bacterium]
MNNIPRTIDPRLDPRLDEELVVAINQYDHDAFAALVYRHQSWAIAQAFRQVQNYALACDVVQQTFVYVWKKVPRLELQAKFRTWLYPCIQHRCCNVVKEEKRWVVTDFGSNDCAPGLVPIIFPEVEPAHEAAHTLRA